MGSAFKTLHRWTGHAFTRVRSLTFEVVLVMVLRKSVKSLQNVVNEAMAWLGVGTVTASAYSQARYKLKHTAFIELNRKAVVGTMYADGDYKRFWGFRIVAVDGSKIALPDTDDVRGEFGAIAYAASRTLRVRTPPKRYKLHSHAGETVKELFSMRL